MTFSLDKKLDKKVLVIHPITQILKLKIIIILIERNSVLRKANNHLKEKKLKGQQVRESQPMQMLEEYTIFNNNCTLNMADS